MRKYVRNLQEGDMFDAEPLAKQVLDLYGGCGKDEHADAIATAAENIYFECCGVKKIYENDETTASRYVVLAEPFVLPYVKDCLVNIKE